MQPQELDESPQPADVELASVPTTKTDRDPFLVAFEEPYDAENPRSWSRAKKWTVTDIMSATGFNRIWVSTIMAPALALIAEELDMNSVEALMSMSSYMLATAFGPLIIGPCSEIWGRAPILHASNIWFLVWNLVCGFANSKGLLIAARLLAGQGASAIYALAGGVLGDVWAPEQRGRSLGIYLLIPLVGAAVGPIIAGFMAGRTTWRWMFWASSAFQAVMVVASFPTFQECYGPVILKHRADKLRKDTGEDRYYTLPERNDADRTPLAVIRRSLSRPLRLLLLHPIIQITAIISAYSYGILYIILSTFSDMWVREYGQSVEISGLHYIAAALGEILGAQVAGALMDRIFKRLKSLHNGESRPEYHVPLFLPATLLGSAGLLTYGWTIYAHAHWILVDLALVLALLGMQVCGSPIQAYVIDSYPEHASSATAAMQFLRSLAAFGFPLFSPKMYEVLGHGWGNSLLAFVNLVLGLVAVSTLWWFGERLRGKAASSY